MSGFGTRLRRLRISKDVTQQELADLLKVKSAAISKYETGSKSYPKIEFLIQLAEYFGVSIDYLLRGVETVPIEGGIKNSSVSNSFQQADNGSVIMNGHSFSPEVMELVKIYELLNGNDRFKLIRFALDLEKESGVRDKP